MIDQHPECADASQIGPLVALGCREGCVARVRPQVVCVDDPPGGLLGLDAGAAVPEFAAVWDSRGECQGYRLLRLSKCAVFDNFAYSWAKHPSQAGEWCSKAAELRPDWGYFERAPLPGLPTSGGGGREFCHFEDFAPNE